MFQEIYESKSTILLTKFYSFCMVHFKLKFKYSFNNNNVTLKQHLLLEIYDILMDGCLLWLERIVARSLGVITFIYNFVVQYIHSYFKFVLYNLGGKKREGNTSNTNWKFITRLNFMRLWISKRRNKFLFLYLYDKMLINRFQLF